MNRSLALAILTLACHRSSVAPNPSPAPTPVPVPTPGPVAAIVPQDALLAHVPADAPFVLATMDPIPDALQKILPLPIRRFAVWQAGATTVLRVELASGDQQTKTWGPAVSDALPAHPADLHGGGLVGWIDLAHLIPSVKLDEAPPKCRDALQVALASVPRIVLTGSIQRDLIKLQGSFETPVDVPPPSPAPGLVAAFVGSPLIAIEGAPIPAWRDQMIALTEACADAHGAPPPVLGSFAAAIWDAKWEGFLPSELDGYLALGGHDGADLAAKVASFFADSSTTQRGDVTIVAGGSHGKKAAAAAPIAGELPYFLTLVDVARIRALLDKKVDDGDAIPSDDDEDDDDAITGRLGDLVELFQLRVDPGARGPVTTLELALGSPIPPSPRDGQIAACRQQVDAMWTDARPALDVLGVKDPDGAIERTYKHSNEATDVVFACLKHTGDKPKRPPLVNAFSPDLIDPQLRPAVDAAAELARLAGTWKLAGQPTWRITADGHVARSGDTNPLEVRGAGLLTEHVGDQLHDEYSYFLDGDKLHIGFGFAAPAPDPRRFVARLDGEDEGWLVRRASGCTLVHIDGSVEPTSCKERNDDQGNRVLEGNGWSFVFVDGWVMNEGMLREVYSRE